jgi:serine kinase of HPr protein (carbohydrate metabolism regulator)
MKIEGFVDRTEEINRRIEAMSTEDREYIGEMKSRMAEEDRIYKMHLATVREAGHQTQAELARRLRRSTPNVSRTERATDMLYSTLLAYLEAAGAKDVSLTATVGGKRVEIALAEAGL